MVRVYNAQGDRLLEGDSVFHKETKDYGFVMSLLPNGNIIVEWEEKTSEVNPLDVI
jgi:hypothetical protein